MKESDFDIEMNAKPFSASCPLSHTTYGYKYLLKPYFWPSEGKAEWKSNRIRSIVTWILIICGKLSSLSAPLALSSATNDLQDGQLASACYKIIYACSFRFLCSLLKELQSLVYLRVKQSGNIHLAEIIFTHIHRLSLSWHQNKKMGSVIRVMTRGTSAVDALITYLFLFLLPAILECCAVCAVLFLSFRQFKVAAVALIGVSLYLIVTFFLSRWRKQFKEASKKHDSDYHDIATESLMNYETIKYFTAEKAELNKFCNAVAEYQYHNTAAHQTAGLLACIQQAIINVTVMGCLICSAQAVVEGSMTIGEFVAVNSYAMGMFAALGSLSNVYNNINQAIVDVSSLLELLNVPVDICDTEDAVHLPFVPEPYTPPAQRVRRSWWWDRIMGSEHQGLLEKEVEMGREVNTAVLRGVAVEFRDVCFRYPGQSPGKGLSHVNFRVEPGTTTAIVGHTGSFKTSILRLLFRFYEPLSGSITIADKYDISHVTLHSLHACIGVVPQEAVLFHNTILYNIQYGRPEASMEEIEAAAEAAQILDYILSLPDKWLTVVGERGYKLSGGEKQRVAIARCLLKNPPIVLLDEATSALDSITEASIQEALRALGRNRTTIVIAHRLSTVMNADQILVMREGQIIERGTHEQLLERDQAYSRMWKQQFSNSNGSESD